MAAKAKAKAVADGVVAAKAMAAKANTTGAMPMTGVEKATTDRRHSSTAKATGVEKASGDNSSSNGAHSILQIKEKAKETGVERVDLRLQPGVVRGRPSRAARLAVSFPLAGRQKFRSTGQAKRR